MRRKRAMPVDTRKVQVEVQAQDISRGVPRSSTGCALALALNRLLRPGLFADVVTDDANLYDAGGFLVPGGLGVKLPAEAQHFIVAYDRQLPVEPLVFAVVLPVVALKEGVER